jgi:hypothetical protein
MIWRRGASGASDIKVENRQMAEIQFNACGLGTHKARINDNV